MLKARRIAASRRLAISDSLISSGFFMSHYPDTPPDHRALPDDYLVAIGNVCAVWGALESVVELAITKLTGMPDNDVRPAILIAHMSWPQRMDVLETHINVLTPDFKHLAGFANVKPLLKKAQEGRNFIIHASWAVEDGKVNTMRVTARGSLKFTQKPVTVAEIDGIAMDIKLASLRLFRLIVNK